MRIYGIDFTSRPTRKKPIAEEPGGDHLDALLCAIQAAWAWARRDQEFGAPRPLDPLEGRIADPTARAGYEG